MPSTPPAHLWKVLASISHQPRRLGNREVKRLVNDVDSKTGRLLL